jgi:predicted esterase
MSTAAAGGRTVAALERAGFHYVHRAGDSAVTAVLLHGTGGDEFDLLELGAYLAPGATLLSPRGRAPEGSVNRWFARFAPGVLDTEDIIRRAGELETFVRDAVVHHELDADRTWAVGFSNGANMAAAEMLLHPEVFAGAVLLRPMLPLRPERVPDLSGRPVYVAAGTMDTMIPRESTEELVALLRRAGADVTESWVDAGHRFGVDEVTAAREWLTEAAGLPL